MAPKVAISVETLQRLQWYVNWFQQMTAGVNWYRIAFIFLPAIIRGELSAITLYLPFIFGYLLNRSVTQMKSIFDASNTIEVKLKTTHEEQRSWIYGTIKEMILVLLFLGVCNYLNADTKFLANFFLSSFVCPMIRVAFPQPNRGPLWKGRHLWDETWGETLVHVFIALGLSLTWLHQGIDQLFLGFLFLLAVPAIQDRFWMRPRQHAYLVAFVMLCSFPFLSLGIVHRFFPSYTEYFPKPYLQTLLLFANASPSVPDYYQILGVSADTDMRTIKKVFREMSVELHPDKVGEDPVKLARFHQIREAADALTKGRAKYDSLIENQELHEIGPRCEAFMIMWYFWLLHTLIDWIQIEDAIMATKADLRNYILQDRRIDMHALGLTADKKGREQLKRYCEKKEPELPNIIPTRQATGSRDDILAMRRLLQAAKMELLPFPHVTGSIVACQQEVMLMTEAEAAADGAPPLPRGAEAGAALRGCAVTIEGPDVRDGTHREAKATVAGARSGNFHGVVVLDRQPDFEPEMGRARFRISPPDGGWPGGKGGDVEGTVGFHVYGAPYQAFILADGPAPPTAGGAKLCRVKDYYVGYRFEVWAGDVLVGYQRVQEFQPEDCRVLLKGPLVMAGTARPTPGCRFELFPDQLIPQRGDAPHQIAAPDASSTAGKAKPPATATVAPAAPPAPAPAGKAAGKKPAQR